MLIKKLFSLLRNQVVLLLLALSVLLLVVYLAWPLFSTSLEYRRIALLLLGFGGLILIIISAIPHALEARQRRRASMGPVEQELDRALEAVAEECSGRGSLYKIERALSLPWVLVLGSPHSGKSAALGNAGFARPFSDPATKSPLCTFWLAQDVIFVHPRARLLSDETLWKGFLMWLARWRRIEGVLLHVSAADLVARRIDEIDALAGHLQRRLWEVSQRIRADLPLQLMIGQCDRLDGFVRFFADIPESERTSVWGLSFTQARDFQLLGPLMKEGFPALIGALLERLREPFNRARTPDEQSAVLAFPQEVQRLAEATARFLDALYPRGLGEGRSRLQEICLCSTLQEGQVIPGVRHEIVVDGLLVRLSPGTAAPLVNLGSFFLRQPLLRLQSRAQLARRPRLHWHAGALGISLLACASISAVLGRGYAHHMGWLQRTQDAVQALQALPPLSRGSDEQLISTELEKEEALSRQVCRIPVKDDSPDCVAEDLTRMAHDRATDYLGCRISSQFVNPLTAFDSSAQQPNAMYKFLFAFSGWRKGQSGKVLLEGFNALKATTLLQKRRAAPDRCPQPTLDDRRWLVEYLAELWEFGHDRMYSADLRRSLGLFAKLYMTTDHPFPALGFNRERVDKARENLRTVFGSASSESDAEMLFYLSASELGLLSGKPLLSGPILKDEQKLDQVYTAAGCASLFNPKGQWDRWMSCVRDDEPSSRGQGQPLRNSLLNYYRLAYLRAWVGWLNGFQQAKDLKPDELIAAGDAVQSLGGELKRVLLLMGRGPMKKSDGKSKEPDACVDARHMLAIFPFAAGEAIEVDQDGAALQLSYNHYQEALANLSTKLKALSDWRPDPSQNSLKPSDEALQSVADLSARREELITTLNRVLTAVSQSVTTEGSPQPNQPLNADGLGRALAGFEGEIREVILARLRVYLQARWEGLYGQWAGLRPKSNEEAGNPDLAGNMRTFLTQQMEPFLANCIVPLYTPDLASCHLRPTLDDGKRQILCAKSCRELAESRMAIGRSAAAAAASQPAPPAPEKSPTYLDPTIDIPECSSLPQEVWLNMKEFNLRYFCEQSTGTCRPKGKPAGLASVSVTYRPSGREETLDSADLFLSIVGRHKVQPEIRRGPRVLVPFRGPGNCQVKLFLDPAMLTKPGVQTPRAPANPLLKLNLPDRLVCQ